MEEYRENLNMASVTLLVYFEASLFSLFDIYFCWI